MHVALIGSGGVGKTTVFNRLGLHRPDIAYFSEAVRHQVKAFGFSHPIEDICAKFGIGAFELFNTNAWSVIDPAVNSLLPARKHVVTDRSAVDNMAYFLAMSGTVVDGLLEPLVLKIARHYASLYDRFVYFPCGVFPCVGDDMRPADAAFQKRVDACISHALALLDVPLSKVHRLRATDVDARVEEVLDLLPAP